MNWLDTHGAKLLAFITAVCALAVTQAQSLHLPETALAWITFVSGVATLAHTIFLGNGVTK